jgi:ubiquitin-conjugating enzyme E2 T
MSHPNPEDGLMAEITQQYKENNQEYIKTATQWTEKHARDKK